VCLLHKAQIYQFLNIRVAINALKTGFDGFKGLQCLNSKGFRRLDYKGSVRLAKYKGLQNSIS
jgi:hypothetical protein